MPHGLSRWLPERGFLRKLLTLASGTIAGQALVLLSSPLLTRLYTPEEFGVFAVFAALAGIAAVSVALRYEFAIPVPQDDQSAAAIVVMTALSATASAMLISVLVLFGGAPFAALVDVPTLAPWLWLLPPAALLWGMGSALSYWSVRRNTYRINGLNRTLQLGSQAGGQVALGILGAGTPGLLLGYVIGYAVRFCHFVLRLPLTDLRLFSLQRPDFVWRTGRVHWRYPALALPSSMLQAICDLAPALFVVALYGPAMAGWYALAQRMMGAPVKILSDAASQIFLGEVRGLQRNELRRFFLRTLLLFVVLGLIGMLPLFIYAPSIFYFVFGEEWREAGIILQILIPLYFSRFVVFPVSQILFIFNRHDLNLFSAVLNFLALAGSFGAAAVFDLKSHTALILFSVSAAASFFFYLGLAWHLTDVGDEAA